MKLVITLFCLNAVLFVKSAHAEDYSGGFHGLCATPSSNVYQLPKNDWMSSNPCGSNNSFLRLRNEFETRFWDYAMRYVWKKIDRSRDSNAKNTQFSANYYVENSLLGSSFLDNYSDNSSVNREYWARINYRDSVTNAYAGTANTMNYKLRVSTKRALVKLSYDFY